MFTRLKITIAIAICATFVFRLFFVNISAIPASGASQINRLADKHFSDTQKKRRRPAELTLGAIGTDYATLECCEESSVNEEDPIKENSPVVLSFIHSLLKYIAFIPKSNPGFDLIKSNLYSKKYLSLSILRI